MSELQVPGQNGSAPRIKVSVGRTIGDKENFGSFRFDVGVEVDVPPGKKIGEFIDQTYINVHNQLVEILKKNGLVEESDS